MKFNTHLLLKTTVLLKYIYFCLRDPDIPSSCAIVISRDSTLQSIVHTFERVVAIDTKKPTISKSRFALKFVHARGAYISDAPIFAVSL